MEKKTTDRKNVMRPLCLAGAALFACLQPAQATDYSWHTASDGSFLASENWSPTGAPDSAADKAIFGVPGEYLVEFSAFPTDPLVVNKSFEVSAGTVAFDLVFDILMSEIGVTYRLEPPSSMFTTAARVGTVAGAPARLIVAGGEDGTRGTVEAEGMLAIGVVPGSEGQVDIGDPDPWVLGGQADWTSTYPTWIGMGGDGTLIINSGTLTDGGAIIGLFEDSQGAVTVDHGADWTNHGSLTVGHSGSGVLNIHNPTATDGDAYIGRLEGSDGSVTVDWSDWDIGGHLYVGGDDQEAGGAGEILISGSAMSAGDVNVAGSAIIWPTGEVSIEEGGTFSVGDLLFVHPGSQISLSEGALEMGGLVGFDASVLSWTGGEVNITHGGLNIDVDEPFGAYMSLFGDKSLSVGGCLSVGPASNGAMQVTAGGTVTSGSAVIGSLSEDMQQGCVVVAGADSSWTIAGNLNIRGYQDALLAVSNGATVSSGDVYLSAQSNTHAAVVLDGVSGDALWDCTGDLYVGGNESGAQGAGTVEVRTGAELNVAGAARIWDGSVVEIDGGRAAARDLDIAGEVVLLNSGVLDVSDGRLGVEGGGSLSGAVTGDSLTGAGLRDGGTSWSMPGSLLVGAPDAGVGHVGALTVETGAVVDVDENVAVTDGSRLVMAGGTVNAAAIDMLDQDFNGFGALNGEFSTTGSVTAAGTLTIGDIDSYDGVLIGGALDVGPHHVTVKKSGLFTISNSTSIAGGVLTAPNGVALPVGNNLTARGTIAARVVTQAGSTLEASGDLMMGDPASPIGFAADGDLVVNDHVVTLEDSNEAVLGPITSLGANNNPGTLTAANGLVVSDSGNIVGFGEVDTPDDPAKPLVNDGAIFGDTANEKIELTGYVKGFGMLDYVTITGVDDLGSVGPAAVDRGSVDYAGKVVIEIGGLFAGTEHDQINHSGAAGLGGELTVELIGGFEPDLGDSFTVMTYAGRTGQFDAFSLPALAAGLEWSVAYGTTSLTLTVVEQFGCPNPGFAGVYCMADIEDGNCLVNLNDLARLLGNYGIAEGAVHSDGDLDDDGDVDLSDLASMLGQYGDDCN